MKGGVISQKENITDCGVCLVQKLFVFVEFILKFVVNLSPDIGRYVLSFG